MGVKGYVIIPTTLCNKRTKTVLATLGISAEIKRHLRYCKLCIVLVSRAAINLCGCYLPSLLPHIGRIVWIIVFL